MALSLPETDAAFSRLREQYTFVTAEKHGGALRNTYHAIPSARPDIVIGNTLPWAVISPEDAYVTEQLSPVRGVARVALRAELARLAARGINKRGKPAILYGWFNSPTITYLQQHSSIEHLITRDAAICGIIEDKSRLADHLKAAGCDSARTLRHQTVDSAQELPSYRQLYDHFGLPFVLQGRSMGGDGTFIIKDESDFTASIEKLHDAVRISGYTNAPYSSLYCLSLPSKDHETVVTYVDAPSHKPVNVHQLGGSAVSGAGGDWRPAYPSFDMAQTVDHIAKLAEYFYQQFGYFGHFVVEGFVQQEGFHFHEINARPGGGSEVNSCNQLAHDLTPFTPAHILGHLGLMHGCPEEAMAYNTASAHRAITVTNNGVFYLKYSNSAESSARPSSWYRGSGIYRFEDGDELLVWSRRSSSTTDANTDNGEVLIANGPPAAHHGTLILPGKQLCVIEGHGTKPVVTNDNNLTPFGHQLAQAVHRLFLPVERNSLQ